MTQQGIRAGRRQRRNGARSPLRAARPAAVLAVLAATASAAVLPAGPAASASSGAPAPAVQLVRYHGYQIQVPASWPVYHLAADPARCVLFNTHAVYLGTPGPDQQCPARAVGRTSAVLIQPAGAPGQLPLGTAVLPSSTAALPARASLPAASAAATSAGHALRLVVSRAGVLILPAGAPGQLPVGTAVLPSSTAALPARASLPAASAAATAAGHALRLVVSRAGVLVTATYGSDPAQARQILASARTAGAVRTGAAQAAVPRASTSTPAVAAATVPTGGAAGSTTSLVGRPGRGLGFDTCTAPSTQTMSAWRVSPYRVIGTYLGGANWACGYGNFNSSWIATVTGQGWQSIPIWVGLQAPCYAHPGVQKMTPAKAYNQGKTDAAAAVATAQSFGYGQGSPVYFDMESYPRNNAACTKAVVTFLSGWTRRLHTAGYKSGVYSSATSAIADLDTRYHVKGYPRPDDIWIADWAGNTGLADPAIPGSDWAGHKRLHQFYGGHNETWGGVTVDVDDNAIGGMVASARATHITAKPSIISQPDAIAATAGKSVKVRLVIAAVGHKATVHWAATPPAGLMVTPSQGSRTVRAHRTATVTVRVAPAATLTAGHYDIPVTATAGTRRLTETFELVSVTNGGTAPVTHSPIILYAADPTAMTTASTIAGRAGLPATSVTGTFAQAWTDTANGKHLVIAVGQAAANALGQDACGWPLPSGAGKSTANAITGRPLRQPAGARVFELGNGTTSVVAQRLLHYAVAGTLPGGGLPPSGSVRPTATCLGTQTASQQPSKS